MFLFLFFLVIWGLTATSHQTLISQERTQRSFLQFLSPIKSQMQNEFVLHGKTYMNWMSICTYTVEGMVLYHIWFLPLEWSSCCPKYNFMLKQINASTISTTSTTANLLREHTSAARPLASLLGPVSWWMHWQVALMICNSEAPKISLRFDQY